ncbi:MAG: MBL fold metallo-hydrolase [Oscillospiraceae bacterium]|nr:MBL fold metallo-hydrolase [Oscillospiraceae bacterium]
MRIRYLGTGASEGFPGVFCQCPTCVEARLHGGRNIRRRSAMLIDGVLLVDLPPDLLSQSFEWKIDMGAIRYLLVTHTHHDHFYAAELANLRAPYTLSSTREKMVVLGSVAVWERMVETLGAEELIRLEDVLSYHELKLFEPDTIGPYTITPLKARHCPGAFIYLIEKDGRVLLYGNDTGFFPEETWDYLAGRRVDMVSMDCTNPLHADTPNHMTLEDNVTVKRRMFQQKSATAHTRYMATHFSHTSGLLHRPMEDRLRLYGVGMAYDGLEVEI